LRKNIEAINKAMKMEHKKTEMFGDGRMSEKKLDIIKSFVLENRINLMKGCYDL